MACDNVIDFVTRETGRFSTEIFNRVFPTSPWVGLIKKDQFPSGMGEVISNLTYGRAAPVEAVPAWTAVTVTAGDIGVEGGACLPPAKKIAIGSTVRTWQIYRRVLEGPDFCAEELRTPFAVAKQLENILQILTQYTRIEWEIRYRHEYLRLAGLKVVVGNVMTESTGESFAAVCPTGTLTQGVLNRYKSRLRRDGADMTALGRENGVGIFTLITDEETSDRLIFENADIRQDLRWGKPSELLAPYGVDRSYRGFYHLIDMFPIRYTCAAGVYTEVAAFNTVAATKGNVQDIRSAYTTAPYTTSVIFNPAVFTSRIPRPVVSPGADVRFDPVNYMGMWTLKNILDRVCNPDGTIVYHRGILASASEPVHPERGIYFVHLRCDPALNLATSCT